MSIVNADEAGLLVSELTPPNVERHLDFVEAPVVQGAYVVSIGAE